MSILEETDRAVARRPCHLLQTCTSVVVCVDKHSRIRTSYANMGTFILLQSSRILCTCACVIFIIIIRKLIILTIPAHVGKSVKSVSFSLCSTNSLSQLTELPTSVC